MFHFILSSDAACESALNDKKAPLRLVWLHGWGQSHKSFLPLANYFKDTADNLLLDFAGFGVSAEPEEPWGSKEYGDEVIKLIEELEIKAERNYGSKGQISKKNILISHSFGGRVAIQMAAKYPDKISGIILIAGAGLKAKRSLYFKMRAFLIKRLAKIMRALPFLKKLPFLRSLQLGSADYRLASPMMKKVLVKAVNEDLSSVAKEVKCPALLIYGSEDTETPSYFGKTYSELIKNSRFVEIPSKGHNSILTEGRHQLENLIEDFLKDLK